ncbi:hypothetical protein [Actinosynnema sp. NPDC023587]|uniref:hypothetical protein n=1 Tax=Actinosynnema sp. NPDC023587 TaxID=3154695 RepID=UPI0033F10E49
MSTTVGHIRGIVTLDTSGYKAQSKEVRADAKGLKQDVEAQKPKLDADARPFARAVATAEAASASLDAKVQKNISALDARLAKSAGAQETALGRVRTAQAALDALRNNGAAADRIVAAEERLAEALRGVAAGEREVADLTRDLAAAHQQAGAAAEDAARKERDAAAAAEGLSAAKTQAAEAAAAFAAEQGKAAEAAASGSVRITAARAAEQQAAERARAAERALADVRLDADAPAARVEAAEQRVAAASRAAVVARLRTIDAIDAEEKARARAAAAADKATDQVEQADRKVGRFTATLVGMGVAGGAGGVLAAGGIGLVAVALVALAAAALKTDQQVSDAFGNLKSEGLSTVKQVAEPLRGELVDAAGKAVTGLRMLAPVLRRAADEGGPSVALLTDGLVRLAVQLGPGLLEAARTSAPAVAGLNALLDRSGRGLSAFLREVSQEAPAAGRAAGDMGRLIEDLLGSSGRLAAMLAQQGAGPWSQFVGIVDQTTDAAIGLGEGALPSVTSSASTVLGVVSRLLDLLGPLAPALGTIGGILLSYRAGAAILGAVGDGVGRLGGRMESASAGGTKLAGATRGLGRALGDIGPYGAIAGGALLGLLAVTDQLYGSTDQLASGLMAGGNAAATTGEKLRQNAVDAAYLQNSGNALGQVIGHFLVPTMDDAREAIDQQRASMTTLQRAQLDATAAAADHSRAVEQHGPASREAADASVRLTAAQQALKDAQFQAADATKSHTDRMIEQQAAALGLAGSGLNLRAAHTQLAAAQQQLGELQKSGTASTIELDQANQNIERSMLAIINAAGQEAAAHHENKDSVEAQTAAVNASNGAALQLAASMSGPLPQSLQTMVANMDDSSLSAIGATRSITSTGQAVISLPGGKTIKIEAKDLASDVISAINKQQMEDKFVYINLLTRTDEKVAPDWISGGRNKGGWIPGGGPDVDSKLTPTTTGEFVVTRKAAQKWGPWLEAINAAAGGDVRMPDSALAAVPMPMLRLPAAAAEVVTSRSGSAGLDSASGRGNGGRTVNYNITMNAVRSLPTAAQLRDVLHDAQVQYGAGEPWGL